MKLYLSSYRVGDFGEELKKLVNRSDAKVAVSINALDFSTDVARKQKSLEKELADMNSLGFKVDHLDLRNYFDNTSLEEHLVKYDAVWFSGGNAFILRKAMRQSGFDEVASNLIKPGKLVYAGYSAAFCVASESLSGVELVDDVDATAEGYGSGVVWQGYSFIDFYPIVHFRSDHRESGYVEREYEFIKNTDRKFHTFKDGDVYVLDEGDEKFLSR